MNIAIVIPTLTLGGAEKIALETATEFARMGHEVNLFVLSDKVILNVPDTIKLHQNVKNVCALKMLLKKNEIEHCISYMERANLISAMACKVLRIKHCATVHTAPISGFQMRSKINRLAIAFTYRMLRFLNTKVIGVCKGIVDDLNKLYGITNYYVVPNFIDVDEILRLSNQGNIKDSYDVLFVGRLAKVKGCHVLIEALREIKSKGKGGKLRVGIIGDGPEKNNILTLLDRYELHNEVQFIGAKKNPYPFMKNSKNIIVPSYAEGFGMVVLEGLSLGKKIIYSRCDFGPREIIGSHFNELSHLSFENPSTDFNKAVSELANIIVNEIENETLVDNDLIKSKVVSNYNKQKICQLFLDVLSR